MKKTLDSLVLPVAITFAMVPDTGRTVVFPEDYGTGPGAAASGVIVMA